MTPKPVHLFYETAGNREYCLSFGGEDAAPRMLFIPPLFDEMNRTRRVIVETMRHLARCGVSAHLLDLPGCNESSAPLSLQCISSWRLAVADAACTLQVTHIASLRGGCLLDDVTDIPIWRLAPAKGAALLKILLRTRIAADKEAGMHTTADQLRADGGVNGTHLAGHTLGPKMLFELESAVPKTTFMATEDALAAVAGTPLWLRSEPGDCAEMAVAMAARLHAWSGACGR